MKIQFNGDGLTVNGQPAKWWQAVLALLGAPLLFLFLLLDALLEAPGKFGMWFCNTLGRAGLPEIGGALLAIFKPWARYEWLPEGEEADLVDALETLRGRSMAHLREPHFIRVRVIRDD
ncbi:hypothetical protein [Methyloversatilis thermotolerans]|uniref:hypothetical protein n=1 Tax=Methyloversatilis thermotolerans TaxID=1346290 RepID=UPI00036DC687|nr:hypothetical protein [Methyloversatilis thermotolerans]